MNFPSLSEFFSAVREFGMFPALFIIIFYFVLKWADKIIESREETISRLFDMVEDLRKIEYKRLGGGEKDSDPEDNDDKNDNADSLAALSLPAMNFSFNTVILAAALFLLKRRVNYRQYTADVIQKGYRKLTQGMIETSLDDGFIFSLGRVLPFEFIPGQLVTSVAFSDFSIAQLSTGTIYYDTETGKSSTKGALAMSQAAYPREGLANAIIDLGKIPFEEVKFAPEQGYVDHVIIDEPGHTYIIKTKNNKYGKIHITELDLERRMFAFLWYYEPSGFRALFNNHDKNKHRQKKYN